MFLIYCFYLLSFKYFYFYIKVLNISSYCCPPNS
nr:MAG TPA: hypothetical protein [Caudoviricetes sp.]